eukprot:806244-Prymnesium_polylepis.1
MADGRWRMTHSLGAWRMTHGTWHMAHGTWRMAQGDRARRMPTPHAIRRGLRAFHHKADGLEVVNALLLE